jgi:hypothetical protein
MNTILSRTATMFLLVALSSLYLTSCSSDTTNGPAETGPLIKYDSIGYYTKGRVDAIVDSVLDEFMVRRTLPSSTFKTRLLRGRHGVSLYKIAYTSVIPERNNQVATVYGLLAIPDSILPGAPIVSYQHGTIFDRGSVPSNPNGSDEVQFQLSQFASQGYIVIASDYFGTTAGTQVPNSYGTSAAVAQACLDMLRASKQVLATKNITPGKLFLSGWSQGGAATNAFLQRLEREQIAVAGTVTASGPANLVGFLQKTINEPTPFVAPYFPAVITSMLFTFESFFGLDGLPEESINPQFLDAARKLHAFEMSFLEYADTVLVSKDTEGGRLRTMNEIFTTKFLDESKSATTQFWKLLDDMNGYRQLLRSPYRCFYSYRDEAVMADVAKIIVDHQKSIGNTTIEGFDAGPNADHGCVYLESLINAKPWFDSMR